MREEELKARLRYLETWGMAYMYLYFTTFIILLLGIAYLVVVS